MHGRKYGKGRKGDFQKIILVKSKQMCYDNIEVKAMDEQNVQQPYLPRPRWQVWTARAALVLFILFVIYQLLAIATGGLL